MVVLEQLYLACSHNNDEDKGYASFLESLKPLIEQEIEKSDYPVFKLNFVK
jgi:hypothetical protein